MRKGRTRRVLSRGPAAKALDAFIERNRIPVGKAAKALGVSHAALINWITGRTVPASDNRKKIDTWTGGEVPEQMWLTKRAANALARVEPFAGSAA